MLCEEISKHTYNLGSFFFLISAQTFKHSTTSEIVSYQSL